MVSHIYNFILYIISYFQLTERYIIKNQIYIREDISQRSQNENIYYIIKNFLSTMIKVITRIIFDILKKMGVEKK